MAMNFQKGGFPPSKQQSVGPASAKDDAQASPDSGDAPTARLQMVLKGLKKKK
jgi:hypothetical protein